VVWRQQLIGVAAVGAWLVLVTLLAVAVRRRWPQQKELSRKLVHIGCGPVVLIAWALGVDRWLALPAAAAVTLLALLNHRLQLLPAIEDVGRPSYGTVAYGGAITLLLALFWPQRPAAAAAGVLVMALGDGAAGLVGPLLASPSWRVLGQRRSLAGTLAMALASLVALGLVRAMAGGAGPPLPLLLLIGAGGVALEQLGWFGLDNLTVPLAVGLLWDRFTP
jgi:phytol kinase